MKKKKDEEIVRVDLLDVLVDENNNAPIYLYDSEGNRIKFEQVAVIPYGEEDLYCILKPLEGIKGVADDEIIIFKIVEDEMTGEAALRIETDEKIANYIYEQYARLVEEANG